MLVVQQLVLLAVLENLTMQLDKLPLSVVKIAAKENITTMFL